MMLLRLLFMDWMSDDSLRSLTLLFSVLAKLQLSTSAAFKSNNFTSYLPYFSSKGSLKIAEELIGSGKDSFFLMGWSASWKRSGRTELILLIYRKRTFLIGLLL